MQKENTYLDVSPQQADSRLNIAPLEGIRTSARRAFLIREIRKVLQGKSYAMVSSHMAGGYLFDKTLPSLHSQVYDTNQPDELAHAGLIHLRENKRYPEVLLVPKELSRFWGNKSLKKQRPYGIVHTGENLYWQFQNCIKGERIFKYQEIEAYRTRIKKIEPCLDKVLFSKKVS